MPQTNIDSSRLYDGLLSAEAGVSAGISPRLIGKNQIASGGNLTVRKALPKTRPPYLKQTLTYADGVQARFTGKFQGSCFYDAGFGESGFIISRGGKLFRIEIENNWLVTEITPVLIISTTADFVVPAAPGNQVTIDIVSESSIATGATVFIDGGEYTVSNRFLKQLLLTYVSGSTPGSTIPQGAVLLDTSGNPIIEYETGDPNTGFQHLFQAENYVIVLRGQYRSIIFDGANAKLASIADSIPPGVMGAYGMGRIWVVLPDRKTFRAGDIVFGSSGTPENGYRDAILQFTENNFLNEGGDFQVTVFGSPYEAGNITSIQFIATPDTSLGMGALIIGTPNLIASVDAPVDRTTWKNLRYPIKTISLIDYGPMGPRNSVQVNSDIWYRSLDGVRSFIIARRNFGSLGNTPQSQEVYPFLQPDSEDLLFFGSAILFDNRLLNTISPYETEYGILHRGLVDINYDLVSGLQGKSAPAWEGIWTGLDIAQVIKGKVNGKERGFIMAFNEGEFEVWEITKETGADTFVTDGEATRTPINAWMNTRAMDFGESFQKKQLYMAEIYLEDIMDDCELRIFFRPDQYPNWIHWQTVPICTTVTQCTLPTPGASCEIWKPNQKGYAARIRLPQPTDECNDFTQTPINTGFEFQVRFEWSGSLTFGRIRVHSKLRQQETQGECAPVTAECKTLKGCGEELFTYNSHG